MRRDILMRIYWREGAFVSLPSFGTALNRIAPAPRYFSVGLEDKK